MIYLCVISNPVNYLLYLSPFFSFFKHYENVCTTSINCRSQQKNIWMARVSSYFLLHISRNQFHQIPHLPSRTLTEWSWLWITPLLRCPSTRYDSQLHGTFVDRHKSKLLFIKNQNEGSTHTSVNSVIRSAMTCGHNNMWSQLYSYEIRSELGTFFDADNLREPLHPWPERFTAFINTLFEKIDIASKRLITKTDC